MSVIVSCTWKKKNKRQDKKAGFWDNLVCLWVHMYTCAKLDKKLFQTCGILTF